MAREGELSPYQQWQVDQGTHVKDPFTSMGPRIVPVVRKRDPDPLPVVTPTPVRSSNEGTKREVAPVQITQPSSGSSGSSKPMTPEPSLSIPTLELSDDTSLVNQFNRLRSRDSYAKQRAIVGAHERSVAGGQIHSTQEAGAAERAIEEALLPMAQSEAELALTRERSNWETQVNKDVLVYKNKFTDYLRDKGYKHEQALRAASTQANIVQSLMGEIGDLLGNTDLELDQAAYDKLIDVANAGIMNTNLILEQGYSYA